MYFPKSTPVERILTSISTSVNAVLIACKDGIDIDVKNHKTKRSNAQNAFYWATLGDIADVLNDAGCSYGEYNLPYTTELLHEVNKYRFGKKTTTKLSVQEFCEYMDRVTAFWIEKTNGEFVPKESPRGYLEKTGLI